MRPQIQRVCDDLDLDGIQCRRLEDLVQEVCGAGKVKVKRQRSRWQECIAVRRKGKAFDPGAIKKLAVEYRAGRCP